MFKTKQPEVPTKGKDIETTIEASVNVKGNLRSDGNVRIDGRLEGEIKVKQHLIVGGPAEIKANITASSAIISGTVEGNLKIDGILELTETGKILGDIEVGRLKIAEGAIFGGECKMLVPEPEKEKSKAKKIDHTKSASENKQQGKNKKIGLKKNESSDEIKVEPEDKI